MLGGRLDNNAIRDTGGYGTVVNPRLARFETSCFDGNYITGDVTSDYLESIELRRDAARDTLEGDEGPQLDLNLVTAS